MKTIEVDLSEIKPYPGNPRNNRKAVSACAASIRRFGYKNPILVDSDMVIICGHTRFAALKRLGFHRITVNVADDLTPDQVRAYRLADNKVAEQSEWNPDLLKIELAELSAVDLDFSMTEFGFTAADLSGEIENAVGNEKNEKDDETYYGEERLRTNNAYNLEIYKDIPESELVKPWNIPRLRPCSHVPTHLIDFNEAMTSTDHEAGVHFYIDDYRFERIWNQPERYIEILSRFDCVLTPDFSLYEDMPEAMCIWNVYRSQLIGWKMQEMGLKVIPTILWQEEPSYEYCFCGVPNGGTVSISSVGMAANEKERKRYLKQLDDCLTRIHPKTILFYGRLPEYDFGKIKVVSFRNKAFKHGSE